MNDLRELLDDLAEDEPGAPPSDLFERIEGRARHLRRRRRYGRIAIASVVVVGAAGAVGVVARSSSTHDTPRVAITPPTAPQPQQYEADGTVLQDKVHGPELCQQVLDSLPPQCTGIPIAGWDWTKVEGEESTRGTTWGSYHVVGTYDGTTLTLTRQPEKFGAPSVPVPTQEFTNPCVAPPGGWTVRDPSHFRVDDFTAAQNLAQSQPDYAGSWVDNSTPVDGKAPFFPSQVVTFTFSRNLDARRAQLEAVWGGPLCVAYQQHTEVELNRIQQALQGPTGRELGLQVQGSGIDPIHNRIELDAIVATPELQRALDEKYGTGVVRVTGFLKPVGSVP